jgi:hypothetical protein
VSSAVPRPHGNVQRGSALGLSFHLRPLADALLEMIVYASNLS